MLHVKTRFVSTLRSISLFPPENIFLIIAILFGLMLALLTPPFQSPDEYIHFYRSYHLSRGNLGGETAYLPKPVLDFSREVNRDLAGNDQNKQSKKALVAEFSRRFEPEPLEPVDIANIAVYAPVPYVPQALGIFIGQIAHLPPIFIFYLGRLVNLFTWIGLVYLSIRIMPFHKRLLLAVSLLPMSVFIAASFSPDAVTNGVSFLWIASVFRIFARSEDNISLKDWAFLALLLIPLALSKSIYIALTGLLVLLLIRRPEKYRVYLVAIPALMAFAVLVSFSWIQFSIGYAARTDSTDQYGMPSAQDFDYMGKNLPVVVPIIARTVEQHFVEEARMFVGILGWLDTPLPDWIYPFSYLLLIFITLAETHPDLGLQIKEKLWIMAILLGSLFIIQVILFNPQVDIGNGISKVPQGRYYLPFAPLFFLPFSQKRWSVEKDSPVWAVIVLIHVIILTLSARALLWRYFAI